MTPNPIRCFISALKCRVHHESQFAIYCIVGKTVLRLRRNIEKAVILFLTLNLQGPVSLSWSQKHWSLLSSESCLKVLILNNEDKEQKHTWYVAFRQDELSCKVQAT